ncbi:MAG TPA: ABC transporter permease [Actinomycetes bacterium]|jgi:ABC-2 type transport system permease protein|nr:ABC transporter permease [Actinomycetes bacterium]
MTTAIAHSYYMTQRSVRALLRQPAYVAVTLIQPVIWLLLFGALFKSVVEIPGFGVSSYITFLTPGVVVMTALFASGWSGMSFIEDIDRGVLDRFLVSPVRRSAMMAGSLAYGAVTNIVQSLIIVLLSLAVGARFDGGALGAAVLVVSAVLLGAAIASLSNALGLLARQRETLIGATQFVVLPLTFLSAGLMQVGLMPRWMQHIASCNPVNWAVEAGREALGSGADWGFVGVRVGGLLALTIVCAWLGTRAFRSYQRSV